MKRTIDLELVPAAGFDDSHAKCPFTGCGALMLFDVDRGELACLDCRVSASTIEEIAHLERVTS